MSSSRLDNMYKIVSGFTLALTRILCVIRNAAYDTFKCNQLHNSVWYSVSDEFLWFKRTTHYVRGTFVDDEFRIDHDVAEECVRENCSVYSPW